MVRLILLTLLIMSSVAITGANADTKTLVWDDSGSTAPTHYEVYMRADGQEKYDYNKVACRVNGDTTTCEVTVPDDGKVYHFVARALELKMSGDSNEVSATAVDQPYSTNKTRTIYHKKGCRYYNTNRGIGTPSDCPTCRPCRVCKPDSGE